MKKISLLIILATLFLFTGITHADNQGDAGRRHKVQFENENKSKSSEKTYEENYGDFSHEDRHNDKEWGDDGHDETSFLSPVEVFGPRKYERSKGKPNTFTESFKALPQKALIIIENGQKTGKKNKNAVKSAKVKINGREVFESDDFKEKQYVVEKYVRLKENNIISVTLKGRPGSYVTVRAIQESSNQSPAPTITLTGDPTNLHIGETSTLTWAATDADSVAIEPGLGILAPNGSIQVSISSTTTYIATAIGLGGTATAQATINYLNTAPIAIPQTVIGDEDASIPILLSGSDVDSNPLTFTLITTPVSGVLSGIAPNLTYTPYQDFNGTDSFTFGANDGTVGSLPAPIDITVNQVNDAPVANPVTVVTDEDTAALVTLSGSDMDGDTLTFQVATPPVNGVLSGTAPNLTYTPNTDYSGSDTFTYLANDGTVDSSPASVSITVNPANDAPVAQPQSVTTDEDTPVSITLTGSDTDGNTLTFQVVTPPANGSISGVAPNLTYTPNPDFNGTDSFTFGANDGTVGSLPAPIDITVNQVNDAPVANPVTVVTDEDTAALVTLSGSDMDGDTLTFQVATPPVNGVLSGTAPNLTYTPNTDYSGSDTFTYLANDGTVDSSPASVSITVNPANDAPVAQPQSVTTDEDTPVSITLTGSDPDGDTLTFQVASPPANGSLSGVAQNLTYTPNPDFNGTDSFTFVANDGTVDSLPTTVDITVNAIQVTVSTIIGLTQTDAVALIQSSGLNVGTITNSFSDVYPAGYVMSQSIGAGNFVNKGTSIDFVTSLGSQYTGPSVSFWASSESIPQGNSTILNWDSFEVQNLHIDNGIGVVATNGSFEVFPDHTTTYTITATGSSGSLSRETTIAVIGSPELQPEGYYGAQYNDLIPEDATVQSYDSKRFSLVTGLVHDLGETPIPNVFISIKDHPEYGTTFTDISGQYTLPVEGGGILQVVFTSPDLITAHRQINVPWNDIAIVETVQMLAVDSTATIITLNGNPSTTIVHQSSEVVDEFGSRSATLVFQGDTRAYAVDEDGNIIHELPSITVRATEFVTPSSMPSILPPTTAYTFCTELTVDGVKRVKFDKPVATFVDNFLGFDVGEVVPVGYYDRDRGVWVGSDNGVVVRLLDTDADGVVDALDATNNDLPDDLNGNGSFADEVAGLEDSLRFVPGSTFWFVKVDHFTPWDFNWPYGPPPDSIPPNPDAPPDLDKSKPKKSPNNIGCHNSYVQKRSRVYHEDIPVPGTDLTLHYASDRVDGYETVITVPVSGSTVPSSLKLIYVNLMIAGKTYSRTLPALPNQQVSFSWDGYDFLGRKSEGFQTAHISIGFSYEAIYYSGGNGVASADIAWSRSGANTMGVRVLARAPIVSWKRYSEVINVGSDKAEIAEGWTISNHHSYTPGSDILVKGDGTLSKNNFAIITTVAGNDSWEFGGDYGSATDASFYFPTGIAVASNGEFYIADYYDSRVRKVDSAGIITTVAGTGVEGYGGDNGLATEALLNSPWDIDIDNSGNLYIADRFNHRIRKVDSNGVITTVAGTGFAGFGGDNGPADAARLNYPGGIGVSSSGDIYIADSGNNRIRKIDSSGVISTVAGNGSAGFGGDNGPAINASLNYPYTVNTDDLGNLYIADHLNNRIRKVDNSGIITTVAGKGGWDEYSGDNGPAILAGLAFPTDVAVDSKGNLYIADTYNYRIRKVDSDGIITTVVGSGVDGYDGDNGPAIDAELWDPAGVAIDNSDNLYIADSGNSRIRYVDIYKGNSIKIVVGEPHFVEGNGLTHAMSSSGLHLSTNDTDTGNVLRTFDYDLENRLVSITDQFNNQTAIARDGDGQPLYITSPDGLVTTFTIDADNNLTKVTYPDGTFYDFEYILGGLMTAEIDPVGNRFDHVFDFDGRITDILNQEGGRWSYDKTTYSNGNILLETLSAEGDQETIADHTDSSGLYRSTITDPSSSTRTFIRSGDSLIENDTLPCGMEMIYEYGFDQEHKSDFLKISSAQTPSGLLKNIYFDKAYQDTNSDGIKDLITETSTKNSKITTFVNDTLQSQKTLTSPEGRVVTIRYDPATLVTTNLTFPGLLHTSYEYDTKGRTSSITTGSRLSKYTYNAQGFLDSVTDPENNTTFYTHDQLGRVTGITSPDSSTVGFSYDNNGNMTMLTNPSTIGHVFGYNSVNNNNLYQTPFSGSYSYIYDKDRRLTQINYPSGFQLRNIYTNGLLTQTQTPEGNIDYSYLCSSKVGTITKGADSVTYGYDGSLVTSITSAGTLAQSLVLTYNNDFQPSSFTYAGATENLAYDNDGLLTGSGRFTITRDAQNGLPTAITATGFISDRSFNGYGEIDSESFKANTTTYASWGVTHDDNGRIVTKSETVNGGTSDYVYGYDSMGRLLTVHLNGTLVEEYQYNANGSRSYEMNSLKGIAGQSYTYSIEDHLMSAGGVTYQYDPDGFLVSKTEGTTTTGYNYSSRGELLSATLPNGKVVTYKYDPLGRRVAKLVDGVLIEKYLWSGLTQLLAVYDASDNILARFEYADSRMPYAMVSGGTTYYLGYDQVGSLRSVADSSGTVLKEVVYDSFGKVLSDSNQSLVVPFGFAGGLYDADTGLVRFGYRDFDPEIGRWTAKDPIGFAGGDVDLFGYVLNDPIDFIDPMGLERWPKPGARHTVGRPGTIVPPGGKFGTAIEKHVASGWEFGKKHDKFVDKAKQCKIPDPIINIPSMVPVYLYSVIKDNSEMSVEDRPEYFPIINIEW